MIACRAGYVLLPTHRTPSQAVLPDTSRGVHYLGKCGPGLAADGDDLGTTPGRSPWLRRADLAGPWAELAVRWQADPHKRTSAEERKRHSRAEVSPIDATSLQRAAVWSASLGVHRVGLNYRDSGMQDADPNDLPPSPPSPQTTTQLCPSHRCTSRHSWVLPPLNNWTAATACNHARALGVCTLNPAVHYPWAARPETPPSRAGNAAGLAAVCRLPTSRNTRIIRVHGTAGVRLLHLAPSMRTPSGSRGGRSHDMRAASLRQQGGRSSSYPHFPGFQAQDQETATWPEYGFAAEGCPATIYRRSLTAATRTRAPWWG